LKPLKEIISILRDKVPSELKLYLRSSAKLEVYREFWLEARFFEETRDERWAAAQKEKQDQKRKAELKKKREKKRSLRKK